MYNNIIINKYIISNVFWSDFEKTIYEYMKKNRDKFSSFTTLVRCKLLNEDISISITGFKIQGLDASRGIFYKYCQSEKIRDYIFHRAMLKNIKLDSYSIISNVMITFFSNYDLMSAEHKLQQPRRVLESKLLKNI